MAENRCSQSGCGPNPTSGRETVCIDTYRILDSSRDRDCYEDVRIYLTAIGQEVIDNTCTVRVRTAEVVWTQINVDPIPFNCGFYQLTARYYVKLTFEGCVGNGRSQDFAGIAVLEKRAVLYGGEGSVKIFSSSADAGLCDFISEPGSNLPVGVVEVVDPIALSVKICDRNLQCGCCVCRCDEIPEAVSSALIGELVDPEVGNRLYVSLGIFSVIRLKRPAQLLISGTDYCVPDKESVAAQEDDPCSLFRTMAFPTGEFTGNTCPANGGSSGRAMLSTNASPQGRCGCSSTK